MDMKGQDKACTCGSGKVAGECCKKDEQCACGSGMKCSECCFKKPGETSKQSS